MVKKLKNMEREFKYRLLHTTRRTDPERGEILLDTKTEYEGTDRSIVERLFWNNESLMKGNGLAFGESMTLFVFSNVNNQDVLFCYYECSK